MKQSLITIVLFILITPLNVESHSGFSSSIVIKITRKGYEPKSITVKKNAPTKITFIRETAQTCGTIIVLPGYKIEKPLPLNKAVTIKLTPEKDGELMFTCGMNMLRGKIIVQ